MKNLIKQIEEKSQATRNDFLKGLKKEKDMNAILGKWYYHHLIPSSSKHRKFADVKELKAYLIGRKNKEIDADLSKKIHQVKTIESAGNFKSIVINVEYKRSRMWGYNPTAQAKVIKEDGICDFYSSGSIGGCGYDKESTAVAKAINQSNEVLKALFAKKNKNIKISNRDLFGYGSGSGLLPMFEGGVGVNCYPNIFEKIGYTFNTISSGKTFTVFQIQRKTA